MLQPLFNDLRNEYQQEQTAEDKIGKENMMTFFAYRIHIGAVEVD
jgi:hypothetical protein